MNAVLEVGVVSCIAPTSGKGSMAFCTGLGGVLR